MKIEELEEKFAQMRELRWMEEIAHDYREQLELIAKNPDYYTITGVRFSCRGSERGFNINPHHPIPLQYLRDGLAEVLGNLEREIETLKTEIER